MKQIKVLSLGGSLIAPEKIDTRFLENFKKAILKNTKKYQFIVVCGGGTTARKYISALKNLKTKELAQSFAGISATRMNARFMSYIFGADPKRGIPHRMKEIQSYLKKQDVVFCGALEYGEHETSDSTAVQVTERFRANFINLTDVKGLYDKNPKKFKNAKLIREISWRDFKAFADEIKYHPGQHFVLDQTAAKMILEKKIKTYIIGKDMSQLDNLLKGKNFIGTTIDG